MNKAKIISNWEAERILRFLPKADGLIFRLSIETGLRISDILDLRAWYLGKIMYVREKKTGKIRIVELSDALIGELQPLKDEALRNEDKQIYAFPSSRTPDKHLHRSTYHRHLKRAAKHALCECSAHSGRKLYAKNVFNETKSIAEVQKSLNHKYITTTATYLGVDLVELLTMWEEVQNSTNKTIHRLIN